MPSEELGPASVHVKTKGFGVSVISENSSVTDPVPVRVDITNIALCPIQDASSTTETVPSAATSNGLESCEGSVPMGPRVYPPSKPHQGSGRQAESLVKLKEELRNGVDR